MSPNNINITISVSTPEAAHALLQDLGLLKQHGTAPAQTPVTPPVTPDQPAAAAPAYPQAPYPPVAPATGMPTYQPQPPAPVHSPQQPAYAAPPAPAAPLGQPPAYTMEDLSRAATPLMDAGRQQELTNLLTSFGVQSLTQLPKEQYGAFATALRQMGARI